MTNLRSQPILCIHCIYSRFIYNVSSQVTFLAFLYDIFSKFNPVCVNVCSFSSINFSIQSTGFTIRIKSNVDANVGHSLITFIVCTISFIIISSNFIDSL
eukprot:173858_1